MLRKLKLPQLLVLSLLVLCCTAHAAAAGVDGGFSINPPLSHAEKMLLADFAVWAVLVVVGAMW